MDIKPQILFGKVMHKRFFERVNQFTYNIYYLSLPLSSLKNPPANKFLKFNKFGLLGFYNKDHGLRDGSDLEVWARDILKNYNINKADGEIVLVTMPRVMGYVFNPVSFWYCYDTVRILRAVICEVNNTFGESHSYVCVHNDQAEITKEDILTGQKVFHVSPFLEREGSYEFRFALSNHNIGVWIDFYDAEGNKKLLTALNGKLEDLTQFSSKKAFFGYPLITLKAIFLIHWQAVKIFFKKIAYVPKPIQQTERITKVNSKKGQI